MDPTPQDYFAKLVDFQTDLGPYHLGRREALPNPLNDEIWSEAIDRRYWAKIAYPNKDNDYYPATEENFAKLENLHAQFLSAIDTQKQSTIAAVMNEREGLSEEVARQMIDIEFDLETANTARPELSHYVKNGFCIYWNKMFRAEKKRLEDFRGRLGSMRRC